MNTAVYERTSAVASPITLSVMKTYLKITATADDVVIQSMIDGVTGFGEKYTGRDFRAVTWKLLLDGFKDRIEIRKDPVATITTVKHLVSASLATVDSSVYYLKKLAQFSELLLNEDQEWPTNTDDREQAIEIVFVTAGYRCQDTIKEAIKRHVAFWYRNRGDCPNAKVSAEKSGVTIIYDQFRISRI